MYGLEWVDITGFTKERHDYFSHFSNSGWFKRSQLSVYLWRVSIDNVWSMTCESGVNKANFVFKMTRKKLQKDLIDA